VRPMPDPTYPTHLTYLTHQTLFHFHDDALQLMSHLGDRRSADCHPAIRRFADDEIERAERGVLVMIVLAKVAPAALATLDRRPGDGFRDRQQAVQIQSGVPAGVVLPMPADADAALART